MLGTGYSLCFLKIAKINSQQEKPICPNRKNLVPQNTKSSLWSADVFPVVASPLRKLFFGGREATTGNTSALHSLHKKSLIRKNKLPQKLRATR